MAGELSGAAEPKMTMEWTMKLGQKPVRRWALRAGGAAFAEVGQDDVGDRDNEDGQDRAADDATDDNQAEGAAAFGGFAPAEGDREDADDHAKTGHEDGAETGPAGLAHGFEGRDALGDAAVGEVHQEDGVFGVEADLEDEAHLAEDVDVHPARARQEIGRHFGPVVRIKMLVQLPHKGFVFGLYLKQRIFRHFLCAGACEQSAGKQVAKKLFFHKKTTVFPETILFPSGWALRVNVF